MRSGLLWKMRCYTMETHCPSPDHSQSAVRCQTCGNVMFQDTHGHWYCHEAEELSCVVQVVVSLAAIFVGALLVIWWFLY